ncbi:unnamed protein product [Paramecium pentaurelia]|uniref:Reverse transcriptase domain-containing protein n=1 Tax=Paramecium pentaurelia TaxID=43138 RepID=A0A8S1XEQ6_9CILI|nr:unnamed protein product [Paramecium pentaurelia]
MVGKEIQFLECTLIFKVPESNEIYYFKNGVPQGSSLSSGLFNIYLEAFMEQVGRKANIQYDNFEYSDDLTVLIKNQYINSFIRCLGEENMKLDLKVNKDKCEINKLKQEKQHDKYIEGNLKVKIMKIKQRVNILSPRNLEQGNNYNPGVGLSFLNDNKNYFSLRIKKYSIVNQQLQIITEVPRKKDKTIIKLIISMLKPNPLK